MTLSDLAKFSHLNVKKDGVLCTRCCKQDPVHPGDGTPLPTFLLGLEGCARRHPRKGLCQIPGGGE